MTAPSQEKVGTIDKAAIGKASTITPDSTIQEAVAEMVSNEASQKVYVVDKEGKYLGTITMSTLLRHVAYKFGVREAGVVSFIRYLREFLTDDLEDLMIKEYIAVTMETPLLDAISLMVTHNVNNLPIVNTEGKIVGEFNAIEVMKRSLASWNK